MMDSSFHTGGESVLIVGEGGSILRLSVDSMVVEDAGGMPSSEKLSLELLHGTEMVVGRMSVVKMGGCGESGVWMMGA